MQTHDLKCKPEFWHAVEAAEKTFEVRRNDRNFEIGDRVNLYLFDPETDTDEHFQANKQDYAKLVFDIPFILPGGQFGISPDFVVLSLGPQNPENHDG